MVNVKSSARRGKPKHRVLSVSLTPTVWRAFREKTVEVNRSHLVENLLARWCQVVTPEMQGVAEAVDTCPPQG